MIFPQRRVRGFRATTGETRHVQKSPGSWDLRYPLPKTEKYADLAHLFFGSGQILCKKSNFERERVNVRSEPDFYWENSLVNFMGQNLAGKVSPLSPVMDTPNAHVFPSKCVSEGGCRAEGLLHKSFMFVCDDGLFKSSLFSFHAEIYFPQ